MEQKKSDWLTPVPKQSLSKMVVEKIKEGLISGELKPGDFLPSEAELSERFGVGNPVSARRSKCWRLWGLWRSVKEMGAVSAAQ